MKTGCYIGRFNPPHKGHVKLVKKLLKKVDKLVIVIGNAKEKNTKKNPFSGKERMRMIKAYLREEKIPLKKVKVSTIREGKSWEDKINNLFKAWPECKFLFTNNKRIINFIKHRVEIRGFRRIGKVSSTKIKYAIHKNKKWEHYTGKSVAEIIKQIKGVERIKKVMNKK